MSARMTLETCSFCRGKGTAEQFQERKFRIDSGQEIWVPEQGTLGLPEHAIDEMRAIVLRDQPWNFRWATVDCPRCQGAREYWVEHVPCKIF